MEIRIYIFAFFFSFTLLATVFNVDAQFLNGQQAIDLHFNKSDLGYIGGVGYLHYFSDKFSLRGGLGFEKASPYGLDYKNFTLDGVARYNLVRINDVIYFTPYVGFTANYDELGSVPKSYAAGFNYGVKGGLEAEAVLNEKVSFFATFNQLLLVRKKFGNERFDYGIGLRLYIGN